VYIIIIIIIILNPHKNEGGEKLRKTSPGGPQRENRRAAWQQTCVEIKTNALCHRRYTYYCYYYYYKEELVGFVELQVVVTTQQISNIIYA